MIGVEQMAPISDGAKYLLGTLFFFRPEYNHRKIYVEMSPAMGDAMCELMAFGIVLKTSAITCDFYRVRQGFHLRPYQRYAQSVVNSGKVPPIGIMRLQ